MVATKHTLQDYQDKLKDSASPPYPEYMGKAKDAKNFQIFTATLAVGETSTFTTAFEVEKWTVYCFAGAAADSYSVYPYEVMVRPAIKQTADKWVSVPGRGKALTVQADTATTDLEVIAVAISDVQFTLG